MTLGCDRFAFALSRYLDDALEGRDRDRFLAHLENCSVCAHALANYRRFRAELQRASASAPAPELRERILAVTAPPAPMHPRSVARVCLLVGVVLFVLISLPVGWLGIQQYYQASDSGRQHVVLLAPRDGSAVTASLRETTGALLPTYLPAGTEIETVSLHRGLTDGRLIYLEVVFLSGKGNRIRFVQNRMPPTGYQLERAGWLEVEPANRSPIGNERTFALQRGEDMIVIEGSSPLEELEAVANSIP